MIRLAAVDMDGTLLNPEGRISERTARTIRDFQNMGRELLICTGRSYADAMEPLKEWGLSAAVACMNGAALYDRQGNLLMSRHMEYENEAQAVELNHLRARQRMLIYIAVLFVVIIVMSFLLFFYRHQRNT